MPLYETVFIARQDIPAQEAEALAEKYSGIVSEHGGSVARREYWGLRTLAYRIKKNRKGHYTMFHLDAPSAAVSEMERNMRLDEDILRYLTIRSDSLDDKPSVIMQGRTAREERTRHETGEVRRGTANTSGKTPSSSADDSKNKASSSSADDSKNKASSSSADDSKNKTPSSSADDSKNKASSSSADDSKNKTPSSSADDSTKEDETIIKKNDEVVGESV